MKYIYNDGGRAASGLHIKPTGDCVCRSIAIASGKPYEEVYNELKQFSFEESKKSRVRGACDPAHGVWGQTARKYISSIGGEWVPVMKIGTGCTMHLKKEELPQGRLVVAVSKHYTASIDRIIHDTSDPTRNGTRCVYGYYIFRNVIIDPLNNE